jgi:hypothetical protein
MYESYYSLVSSFHSCPISLVISWKCKSDKNKGGVKPQSWVFFHKLLLLALKVNDEGGPRHLWSKGVLSFSRLSLFLASLFLIALGRWIARVELADKFIAHVLHVVEKLLKHADQPSVVPHKIINVIFLIMHKVNPSKLKQLFVQFLVRVDLAFNIRFCRVVDDVAVQLQVMLSSLPAPFVEVDQPI